VRLVISEVSAGHGFTPSHLDGWRQCLHKVHAQTVSDTAPGAEHDLLQSQPPFCLVDSFLLHHHSAALGAEPVRFARAVHQRSDSVKSATLV